MAKNKNSRKLNNSSNFENSEKNEEPVTTNGLGLDVPDSALEESTYDELLEDELDSPAVPATQMSLDLEEESLLKKVAALVLSIVLIIGAAGLLANFVYPYVIQYIPESILLIDDQSAVQGAKVVEKPSIFQDKLAPIYENPNRLYFESHAIDIFLVHVGLEPGGKLENPTDWNKGGWYYNSARPGEVGNIIINAHYDNNYGAPAAFWELKNVQLNDRVFLVDELGKIYTYNVTDLFYIDTQDPDRLSIFDDTQERSELTLITCGGVYFPGSGYNKRLVVKAHLQERGAEESTLMQDGSTGETAYLNDD